LDTLPIEKKRRYKVMAWTAATALGLTLVGIKSEAEWTGLAFMAFSLGLIVTGVYTGFADMKLRSAQAREAKRLWIMSCENRICAQCHTVLLPDASSCSSCGGVDLRIAAQGLHPEKTASKGLHPNKTAGKTTVEAAAYTAGAAAGWAAGLIRGVAKNLDNKH
jgi:ribosomal protein L40E